MRVKPPPSRIKARPRGIGQNATRVWGRETEGESVDSPPPAKNIGDHGLREVRDRFNIQITGAEIAGLTFRKPGGDSEEPKYLQAGRAALGGSLPRPISVAP